MKIHFYFYTYLSEPEVLNDYCCGNPACYFERQAKGILTNDAKGKEE